MRRRAVRGVGVALVAGLAVWAAEARGNGSHGPAATAAVPGGSVQVGRFVIGIRSEPSPLTVAAEGWIVAEVRDRRTGERVAGLPVQLGVPTWVPPSLRNGVVAREHVHGRDDAPQPVPGGALAAEAEASDGTPAPRVEQGLSEEELELIARKRALAARVDRARHVGMAAPRLAEEREPGMYRIRFTALVAEPYEVAVRFPDPTDWLTADNVSAILGVTVEPAAGRGALPWVAGAALLALTGGIGGAVAVRRRYAVAGEPFDLLRIPVVRRLVAWRHFALAAQLPNFVFFGLVVLLGFSDTPVGGRNLATKLTWTIWWAAIIFTFVTVGRLWCLMCPFGALNEWASRLSRPARRFPRALRNLWLANGTFLALTWADVHFGVTGSPRATAGIVVIIAAIAGLTGLFFQRRSFCRYLCPIGGLIGIYSMVAPVALRVKDGPTCVGHRGKACVAGGPDNVACPMFELPWTMDRNTQCNLCFECVKGCDRDNLALRVRPLGADLWGTATRSLDEVVLAIVLAGVSLFLTAEMIAPWEAWMATIARTLPFPAFGITEVGTVTRATRSLVFLGVALGAAPLLLLAAAATARVWLREAPGAPGLVDLVRVFGYTFVPIGLGMHLAHNLAHLLNEGPGIVPVVQRTLAKYARLPMGLPRWDLGPLVAPEVLAWLQMGLLSGAYALALVVGLRLAERYLPSGPVRVRSLVPMIVLALVLTGVNVFVLSQPMAPRHFH